MGWGWPAALPLVWAIGFSVLIVRLVAARWMLWNTERQATVIKAMDDHLVATDLSRQAVTTGTHSAPAGIDDAGILAHIERNTTTIYHPVGTCAMGGDSKLAASRLKMVLSSNTFESPSLHNRNRSPPATSPITLSSSIDSA